VSRPPRPVWARDFPYEAAAEEDITRRDFARFLVAGAGVIAAGNVGLALWTQLRTINTGEARRIVALGDVAVGDTYLFRYPGDDDPAIPFVSAIGRSTPSARSAPTSVASCTSRPTPTGGIARATTATSTLAPAT
jgi:hypothetical protein